MQCPKCGNVFIEKNTNGEYACLMRNCMCSFIKLGNRYYMYTPIYTEVKKL